MCNELLFVELPITIAAHLRQAVARVHRNGQTRTGVNCRIAIANGTLQARLWENIRENDSLVNNTVIQNGPMDIRDSLQGKCHTPRDVLNVADGKLEPPTIHWAEQAIGAEGKKR